jgi:hypothetical protein
MKYAFAIFLAVATTGALASMNDTLTTVVVTALTTYCPEATELTHNGIVYTITAETTLTITDCPCTLTQARLSSPPCPFPKSQIPKILTKQIKKATTHNPINNPLHLLHRVHPQLRSPGFNAHTHTHTCDPDDDVLCHADADEAGWWERRCDGNGDGAEYAGHVYWGWGEEGG